MAQMASGGLLIGLLVPLGIIPLGWESFLWLGLAFVWSITTLRLARDAPFVTPLVTGLLAGFLAGDARALLVFDRYAEQWVDLMVSQNQTVLGSDGNPRPPTVEDISRVGVVMTHVWVGGIMGALAAIGAWLGVKVTGGARRGEAEAPREDVGPGVKPLGAPDNIHAVETTDNDSEE